MFYALLTIFAAAVAAVDQWTKVLAQQYLTGTTVTIIPGWLQLHYITNDGMALSLFRGGRWMFGRADGGISRSRGLALPKSTSIKSRSFGALPPSRRAQSETILDRVQTGLVIDMICIPWFSTFNVADIFITFGAIILVLYILIKDKEFLEDKPKKAKEPRDEA